MKKKATSYERTAASLPRTMLTRKVQYGSEAIYFEVKHRKFHPLVESFDTFDLCFVPSANEWYMSDLSYGGTKDIEIPVGKAKLHQLIKDPVGNWQEIEEVLVDMNESLLAASAY